MLLIIDAIVAALEAQQIHVEQIIMHPFWEGFDFCCYTTFVANRRYAVTPTNWPLLYCQYSVYGAEQSNDIYRRYGMARPKTKCETCGFQPKKIDFVNLSLTLEHAQPIPTLQGIVSTVLQNWKLKLGKIEVLTVHSQTDSEKGEQDGESSTTL